MKEQQSEQAKKEISLLKKEVAWINAKIACLFLYEGISLFAYPFALGYWLSRYNDYIAIAISFILFWVEFALLNNEKHLPNIIWEQLKQQKDKYLFYIENYNALKNNAPTVHDPNFLDRMR
jgi:hypothetical protein